MWFLEHESLFGGKRVWLRPGSQQLFGRTKGGKSEEGKNVFIDHKTVSRQHMMLKVLPVQAGDGTKLHTRSQVEITDLSCRQGTIVDGQKTLMSKKEGGSISTYDTMTLSGKEHMIKLSASYPEFRQVSPRTIIIFRRANSADRIKWQPTVFTYASKESKARSAELHALDVKTSSEFVYNQTTHVVSQKRNLPKVLQALVNGTHVITGDFLDAVIAVATSQNDDPENFRASKLEEDFDVWWPKEKEYIPPVGAEPVPRPEQMLEPDPRRLEVFSGLTFVFLNENQYNSLHEPISGGCGKALLFHISPGETTVNEYVEYVRNVAGEKKGGKSSNGQLPVITIRLSNFPDGMEEWATNFVTGVDYALNQRSIQQNEFLDAIITNDTSSLQKPPPEVEIASSMPESTKAEPSTQGPTRTTRSRASSQAPGPTPTPAEEPAKVIPRKRTIRRGVTQSRFTGFDDYEPAPKVRKIEEDAVMEGVQESAPTQNSYRQSRAPSASETQSRRRRQSPIEETIEAASHAELFPAAAAMERRRAATRGISASVEPENAAAIPKPKTKGEEVLEKLQKAKKKASKEIDVREQARLRIKEEEDRRMEDEENLREALEGVDISEIRGLVHVEEMAVMPRRDRPSQRTAASSDGWKDEWNGRKNFKKFRRRGAERVPQHRKVLVALEEAPPKKGFGLGDAFFLEENDEPKRKAEERRRKKTGRIEYSDSEAEPGFTRRKTKEPEVINIEDSGPDDEEVFPESSTSQRNRMQRVPETQVLDSQTQTQGRTRKRPPISVAVGQPSNKRGRVTRRDEDSDDEETGFRFRRRG